MTALWTANDIAEATGGTAHGRFAATGITFDSREVEGGDLFVALKGATTDGHRFIPQALERGAAGLLVSEPAATLHVRVPDTLRGLEDLARAARARATGATIVGVTGSAGKTGVKEALRQAFSAQGATHASVKSYNNHTGVPLSLARMPADTRWGVFEMGMNHAGELDALTRLVRPHIALVTTVAAAHREYFDSEEAIADAKGEIFRGLEPGGTAIIPADNPHAARLRAAAEPHAARILSFGEHADADVRATDLTLLPERTRLTAHVLGRPLALTVAYPGRHWALNALAVLAVAAAAEADLAQTAAALAQLPPLPGRGRRVAVALPGGEAVLIDESYNANPASMAAALEVLAAAPGRRVAVLGAMRELGALSPGLHAALAPALAAAKVAELILVGEEMAPLAALVPATHVATTDEALAATRATLRPGDALLVKGSNGVGLARLVAALEARG